MLYHFIQELSSKSQARPLDCILLMKYIIYIIPRNCPASFTYSVTSDLFVISAMRINIIDLAIYINKIYLFFRLKIYKQL